MAWVVLEVTAARVVSVVVVAPMWVSSGLALAGATVASGALEGAGVPVASEPTAALVAPEATAALGAMAVWVRAMATAAPAAMADQQETAAMAVQVRRLVVAAAKGATAAPAVMAMTADRTPPTG
jgi:hypothetical protein